MIFLGKLVCLSLSLLSVFSTLVVNLTLSIKISFTKKTALHNAHDSVKTEAQIYSGNSLQTRPLVGGVRLARQILLCLNRPNYGEITVCFPTIFVRIQTPNNASMLRSTETEVCRLLHQDGANGTHGADGVNKWSRWS